MANPYAVKTQNVMDTLQQLEMKSTYDNCNYMLGCLQALAEIREYLNSLPEETHIRDAFACAVEEIPKVREEVINE